MAQLSVPQNVTVDIYRNADPTPPVPTGNPAVAQVPGNIILGWYCERAWSGTEFRVNYHRQKELHAIDGVFHLLDGKGPIKTCTGPLETAIQNASDGKGETDYFKFKRFKNHNLHLEFKRLDLVKELNLRVTGEGVLGRDME
jgi:hypothetical protein